LRTSSSISRLPASSATSDIFRKAFVLILYGGSRRTEHYSGLIEGLSSFFHNKNDEKKQKYNLQLIFCFFGWRWSRNRS
jgi:hypothetical protein